MSDGKKLPIDTNIYWFYRWGAMLVPTMLMLAHWGLVWHCHSVGCVPVNVCNSGLLQVALYAMAYVVPGVLLLPATYFFGYGSVWRIPFVYLLGVNAVMVSYGSWEMNYETRCADVAMVLLTAMLYGMWAVRRLIQRVGCRV